jgi:hypothetical protein
MCSWAEFKSASKVGHEGTKGEKLTHARSISVSVAQAHAQRMCIVLFWLGLAWKPLALAWPEAALASRYLRPSQRSWLWPGFGLAWPGPGLWGRNNRLKWNATKLIFLQFCTAIMADHGQQQMYPMFTVISQRYFKSLVYYAGDKD